MVQLDRQNAELVNTLNPNNPNASYGRATTISPMASPNPKASGGQSSKRSDLDPGSSFTEK